MRELICVYYSASAVVYKLFTSVLYNENIQPESHRMRELIYMYYYNVHKKLSELEARKLRELIWIYYVGSTVV